MQPSKLYVAMQDALYGPDQNEVLMNKEKLKAALRHGEELVDSGRLGAIIITEIVDREKDLLMAVPFGESRVVTQSCRLVLQQAQKAAARDLAKDIEGELRSQPEPEPESMQ